MKFDGSTLAKEEGRTRGGDPPMRCLSTLRLPLARPLETGGGLGVPSSSCTEVKILTRSPESRTSPMSYVEMHMDATIWFMLRNINIFM